MKLVSKIAAGAALLGAITAAQAESITFGVEIPPIATLIVRDGILKGAASMAKANVDGVAAAAANDWEVVGGFSVLCNMPKWNIYFGFANGGLLKNQSGTPIKTTGGAATVYLGADPAGAGPHIWLYEGADEINATDDQGTPNAINVSGNANATPITGSTTLTAGIDAGASTATFTNPWLLATDNTIANFDIRTGLETTTDGSGLSAVAGSYTETLYLTLVATY
jgi:hypothetical protein